jgi:restriction system protein
MNKLKALKALGRKRRRTKWDGYYCIGDYYGGRYECDFVSPYSKTAGNYNSPIMLVLQDWSSDGALKGQKHHEVAKLGYGPELRTNKNLANLLKAYYNRDLRHVYITNVFPFIKKGRLNASVPMRDLLRSAVEFTRPEIEIVRPKIVICCGHRTFNAVREAYSRGRCHDTAAAIATPFTIRPARSSKKIRIWCQAHPSQQGQNTRNRGGRKRVPADWKRMCKDTPIAN